MLGCVFFGGEGRLGTFGEGVGVEFFLVWEVVIGVFL